MADNISLKKLKISVPVDDLPLNPQLIEKLKRAHLSSFQKLLLYSERELQGIVKITVGEAKEILNAVSDAHVNSKPVTAFDLLQNEKNPIRSKLSLNILPDISDFCNCIYTGTITEICGESGSGKTQLCLHLSISAQKPDIYGGFNSRVLYIHSEGEFPIKRFLELATAFKRDNPELQTLNLSDNLILKKVLYFNEVIHVLRNGVPDLLQNADSPKLIIIDSVAALLRGEYGNLSSRTAMIQNLAFEIWKLANIHQVAVVCVNQISGAEQNIPGSDNSNIPSLGLLWSNVLTTRLKISRNPTPTVPTKRTLEFIFSSYHPNTTVNFVINSTGLKVL